MIRHLLKPLWKRKGGNLLLSLEIALAFVVVFAIAAAGLRYAQIYREPVGFDYRNQWAVQLEMPETVAGSNNIDPALYDRFRRALEALPQVEKVAFAAYSPYEHSQWNSQYFTLADNRQAEVNLMEVSDGFAEAMGVKLVAGRWFSSEDNGAAREPIVINQHLADALYPGGNAVGQLLADGGLDSKERRELRVVGVVEAFRNQGELMAPGNFVLHRFIPLPNRTPMRTLLLKVKPGTTRVFEAELLRRLKQVRNDWSYRISPLADMRESMLRSATTPLVVLSVIAAFLLAMVAFGLFGVLWQNTTRRVPEIGLRRAIGATASDIGRQIVLEQALLCLLPIAAALLLLVQLPITGALGESLSWPLFGAAALLSTTVMVLVSVGCALYPAWRASRLSPTEALHYE